MKAGRKRVFGVFLALVMAASVLALPREAAASPRTGNREIVIGGYSIQEYLNKKTLDLSESEVQIHVTETDRTALRQAAEQSAYLWFWKTVMLHYDEGQAWQDMDLHEKYWQETVEVDPADLTLSDEAIQIGNKIVELGTAQAVIAALEDGTLSFGDEPGDDPFLDQVVERLGPNQEETPIYRRTAADCLRGKIEEIYNDKFSDFLAEQLESKLDLSFDFAIRPLAEDGSEDATYGVNGVSVKRGRLFNRNEQEIDTVDFGAPDQFYDQILQALMEKYIANGLPPLGADANKTEDRSYYILSDFQLETEYVGADTRGLSEHILMIAGGLLHSSDDSQVTYAFPHGDPNYPGVHSLLEVGDRMGTYFDWKFAVPKVNKYTQTFNLHLNPAVAYLYDLGEVDLITDAVFDENGRLVQISKPIHIEENIAEMLFDANKDNGVGTYRYKLVETGASGSNADLAVCDKSEKYLDVTIKKKSIWEDKIVLDTVDLNLKGVTVDGTPCDAEFTHVVANMGELTDVQAENQLLQGAEFSNIMASTDVKVTKTWDDDGNKDGLRPTAEEFVASLHLYADAGNGKKVVNATPTVTDNGDNTYTALWEDLPKYKNTDRELIEYTVEEDEIKGYTAEIDGLAIKNTYVPELRKVKISKQDLNGYELNGAEIQVLDARKNVVDAWTSGKAPHELEITAEQTYTFHEEAAPFGYKTVTDIDFTVTEEGAVTILTVSTDSDFASAANDTLVITDSRDLTEAEPLYIQKVDENDKPLAGAKMQLKDKNGNITDEWISDTKPHRIDVKPSEYYIVEVSAPKGYEKFAEIHIVTDKDAVPTIREDKSSAAYIEGENLNVINLPTNYVPPTPPKKEEVTQPEMETPKTPQTQVKNLTPKSVSAPKTGVEDHAELYLALGLASLAALAALWRRRRG